jgi:hypothetical protein
VLMSTDGVSVTTADSAPPPRGCCARGANVVGIDFAAALGDDAEAWNGTRCRTSPSNTVQALAKDVHDYQNPTSIDVMRKSPLPFLEHSTQ